MKRLAQLLATMMSMALVALIGVTGPATAAVTEPAPWATGDPTFTAPTAKPGILGVNYQGTWGILTDAQRALVLDKLAASGVKWVRIDFGWSAIQPTGPGQYSSSAVANYDKQIQEIRARGMKVLAIFTWAPKWSSGVAEKWGRPGNPQDYANAAAWVAKRYDGTTSPTLKIDAIEIWNEPDSSTFWNQSPATTKVSDFATLVKTAGPAVRAANPAMKVIVGAPTNVGTAWYTEFYKTPGVIGTYDALGIHPYQSPSDSTPEAYDVKYGDYYMKHIPKLDALMTSKNDPAKIWATEFGWSTHNNSTYASPVPNWKRGVTEAQQADYLLRAMKVLVESPRVEAAFWYATVTTSSGDAQFDNFALLRKDFSAKPALFALKCASAGICGPSAVAAPAAPTGLTATANGTDKVALSWNAATGATGYKVFRDGTKVADVTGLTATDTGLTAGTTYTYTVKATNSTGDSPASAAATATTQVPAPAAPTGLTATANGTDKVALSWNAATGATGYKVFRDGTKVADVTGLTATDTGLTAGTTYTYTVKATNSTGDSPASAAATATTQVPAPAAPTGLTATANGTDKVALSWNAATGATGYKVFRDGTKVADVTGLTATDTGLTAGTTYTYTVKATNSTGDSPASAAATATTQVPAPAAPTGLTATANGTDKVALSWNAATGATGYKVFRDGTKVADVTGLTATDTGLTAGTTYTYTVKATNSTGDSPASAAATATTQVPLVTSYVGSGDVWRFNDTGANLGTAWRAVAYDDSTWRSGKTQLGYGDGDEATLMRWGTDPNRKYMTYYARATFDAGASVADVKTLNLRTLVDDGAVVYLNGIEVYRFNLPTGTITNTTKASRYIAGAEEKQWRETSLPATALKAGTNTIAVEVHNDAGSSSDISLDVELAPQR